MMRFTIALSVVAGVVAMAQNPLLLVLEKESRTLAIVDPAARKVLERVPSGDDPHEVAWYGGLAYISNYGAFSSPDRTISVVDVAARRALTPIDLAPMLAPHGLEAIGGKVYFTAEGSKVIGCYDPAQKRVEWVLGTGQDRTHMLAVTPDGQTIFTSNVNSDTISIFERERRADASGWHQTSVPVGKGPEGFDISPDGKEVWAANSHDGTASVVDVGGKEVVATMNVRTRMANRLKFTPDRKTVLISDLGSGDLVIMDTASRKETHRISLGRGCAGILIAPDGSAAYVAVSPDSNVAIVDLKTFQVTGRIETRRGPDGMAWVSGR